jgi:hypothetical protein
MRKKVRKLRIIVFFLIICGFGGSKNKFAKAAGTEPADQIKDEKLHTVMA